MDILTAAPLPAGALLLAAIALFLTALSAQRAPARRHAERRRRRD